jgi:hypothetical protein
MTPLGISSNSWHPFARSLETPNHHGAHALEKVVAQRMVSFTILPRDGAVKKTASAGSMARVVKCQTYLR